MKNNKYDFIANMFVGYDEIRPVFQKPHEVNGKIYATDAHRIVRFDKVLANGNYSSEEKVPNVEKLFDDLKLEKTIVLDTEDLMTTIYDCQAVFDNKSKECGDCSGSGGGDCPCCGQDSKCDTCYGKGSVDIPTPFAGITLLDSDIKLLGKTFQAKYIYKVIEVALILKQENITAKYTKGGYMGVLFIVENTEILVMSKYV